MNRILLEGCRPEPLASYLKALGVLRIIGNQADPEARGHWSTEGFLLTTNLSQERIAEFFLSGYEPTAIVSPWNGGSGFAPKDNTEALEVIENSTDQRLTNYRNVIAHVKQVGHYDSKGSIDKAAYLTNLRNSIPDEALPWLDAAAVLFADGVRFPVLLGTGGNDGRLDFSNNYMQRLCDALSLRPVKKNLADRPAQWLTQALTGMGESPLMDAAIGQFDPGSAGGSNSAPQGKGKSLVNPWDFVFMLEGAMVFSGAAVRRRGEGSATVSIPFWFSASPIGYGSATDENSRGEIWAPLWEQPTNLRSVVSLFAEGRITWDGQQARSGLDAARAIATLQHDRRISGFVRYVIAERFGLSNIATPVGRIDMPTREREDVDVTVTLDRWLQGVKRFAPSGVQSQVRIAEQALFSLATASFKDQRASLVMEVLEAVARVEIACAKSSSLRADVRPISRLYASAWKPGVQPLLDRSVEARVAWSLASGHGKAVLEPRTLRDYVLPVHAKDPKDLKGGWATSPAVEGFGTAPIAKILSEVAARREWRGSEIPPREESKNRKGSRVAFEGGGKIHVNDAIRFASGDPGDFNEEFFYRCLVAFSILDFRFHSGRSSEPDIPGDNGLGSNIESQSTGTAFELGVSSVVAAVLMHAGSGSPAIPSPVGLARQLETNSPAAIGTLKRSVQIEGFIPHMPGKLANSQWLAASLLLSPDHSHTYNQFLERAGYPSPAIERAIAERKQIRRLAMQDKESERKQPEEIDLSAILQP